MLKKTDFLIQEKFLKILLYFLKLKKNFLLTL